MHNKPAERPSAAEGLSLVKIFLQIANVHRREELIAMAKRMAAETSDVEDSLVPPIDPQRK